MDERFDSLARELGDEAPRRRVLQGLGALALGSLGIAGLGQTADAKNCLNRCKRNCKNRHNKRSKNKKCRKRCRRKCD